MQLNILEVCSIFVNNVIFCTNVNFEPTNGFGCGSHNGRHLRQDLPGRRCGNVQTTSSGQPLFAEAEDEVGAPSPAKVRLAGAEVRTLKQDKKGHHPDQQDGAPLKSYYFILLLYDVQPRSQRFLQLYLWSVGR